MATVAGLGSKEALGPHGHWNQSKSFLFFFCTLPTALTLPVPQSEQEILRWIYFSLRDRGTYYWTSWHVEDIWTSKIVFSSPLKVVITNEDGSFLLNRRNAEESFEVGYW